jgi:fatty-acyl-CoA synthase
MSESLPLTLGDLVDQMARERPDHEALVDPAAGRTVTYGELARETDRLTKGLAALGLAPGDHLALWGGSSIPWILFQYGAAKAGLVVVSMDPECPPDAAAYLLEQSNAKGVVVIEGYKDRDFAGVIHQLESRGLPAPGIRVQVGGAPALGFIPMEELILLGNRIPEAEIARRRTGIGPLDATLLSYTSGTTGPPKGVLCTHQGLMRKSHDSARIQDIRPEDRTGLIVPLYHMFGNTCAVLAAFIAGSAVVLTGPWFDVEPALFRLAQGRSTLLYGAPSQFIALMNHPRYPEADLSSLRGGIMGGAPCPMEVMKRVVDEMGVRRILVGYGQTEASSWITLTRPDDPLELRVSTIGRALPGTEVRVVDPKTGEPLPAGRAGELCARGFLMAGYYRLPAATAKALDSEGWLHTGDLASLDEQGNGRILGRIKDLIPGLDQPISPVDVEEVLYRHPDVLEAAVFGLPWGDGMERAAAWIRIRPGSSPRPEDVIAFCQDRLPAEAVPVLVHITDAFPMTATGKIQKFKMREATLEMVGEKRPLAG